MNNSAPDEKSGTSFTIKQIAVETNHEQHKRSFTKTNQTRYGDIHDNA